MENLIKKMGTMVKAGALALAAVLVANSLQAQSRDQLGTQFEDLSDELVKIQDAYSEKLSAIGEFEFSEELARRFEGQFAISDEELRELEREEMDDELEESEIAVSEEELTEFEQELSGISDDEVKEIEGIDLDENSMEESSVEQLEISDTELKEFEQELNAISDEDVKEISEGLIVDEMTEFTAYFEDFYEGKTLENSLAETTKFYSEDMALAKGKEEKEFLTLSEQMNKEMTSKEYKMYEIAKKYIQRKS